MTSPTALQAATAARESAAQLAGVEWDAVEGDELAGAAAALASAQRMVESALVAVAGQLETPAGADALAAAGWASTRDFLTHLTGGRKGAGGGLVRLAQQTADLPQVREAHATGALSTAQARVIGTRVGALPRDPDLRSRVAAAMLDLATGDGDTSAVAGGMDATDLDRGFPSLVRELDTAGVLADDRDRELAERGAHLARHLSFSPDGLGGMRVRGYASLEEAELVKACLLPLAAPVTTEPGACGGDPTRLGERDDRGRPIGRRCPDPTCSHNGSDPREAGVRLWDALVDACGRLQATDSLPHAHGTTTRLTVTTTYDDLRDQLSDAGLLPAGDTLSASALRRLACDAEIIPGVLGSQGQVLDIGRAQRLVTTAIWLALVLRDRHCAFPGCERLPMACDAHHIVHWADGGPTSLDNLVLLCRRHHTLTHHTPWTVGIDPRTRQPVWAPPPRVDDTGRYTYVSARPPPAA